MTSYIASTRSFISDNTVKGKLVVEFKNMKVVVRLASFSFHSMCGL